MLEPREAGTPAAAGALGPLERVRARFDRDCPPSVPRYPLDAMVTVTRHPRSWVCVVPWPARVDLGGAAWPREAPPPGPRRVVSLGIDGDDVTAVAIGYRDTRAAGEPVAMPCAGLAGELDEWARALGGDDLARMGAVEVRTEDDGRFCEARLDAAGR